MRKEFFLLFINKNTYNNNNSISFFAEVMSLVSFARDNGGAVLCLGLLLTAFSTLRVIRLKSEKAKEKKCCHSSTSDAGSSNASSPSLKDNNGTRVVGFLYEEIFGFHTLGYLQSPGTVEPVQHWESAASKRRVVSLLGATGLIHKLFVLPRVTPATRKQIELVHDSDYVDRVIEASNRPTGDVLGDAAGISHGGYDIALMSAGMCLLLLLLLLLFLLFEE